MMLARSAMWIVPTRSTRGLIEIEREIEIPHPYTRAHRSAVPVGSYKKPSLFRKNTPLHSTSLSGLLIR